MTAPLGVGVVYNPAVARFLRDRPGTVDYLAVTPETFWADTRVPDRTRFRESALAVAAFEEAAAGLAVVGDGRGLSRGTAGPLDVGLLGKVAEWAVRYDWQWYGEHLSYNRVFATDGEERHVGLALPVPYDADVLDVLVARVAEVRARVPVPFVVENGVTFAPLDDEDLTEPQFLTALGRRAGCGVLLDLHNLYVDVVNGVTDADAYIADLDLALVTEIHVAGGRELAGMYTDAHSGIVPDGVWDLLGRVLPRCPNVRGVAFEFVSAYYDALGPDMVAAQLDRARATWAAVPT